ncbi:MAG: acetyl-CoA carboxylase biotin carboxyl carrier protein, partial [Planctomycetota bacterium]
MDLEEVRKIILFMDEHGLVEFEHEEEGKRIKLRRAEASAAVPAAAIPVGAPVRAEDPGGNPGHGGNNNVIEFKSPLIGTFYRASKPDAEPFVNEGEEVTSDKVLCIVEAMKVMNEVKAEVDGVLKE